jgi:hypothetical protein
MREIGFLTYLVEMNRMGFSNYTVTIPSCSKNPVCEKN